MNICRFRRKDEARIGLMADGNDVLDLTAAGITRLAQVLDMADPESYLREVAKRDLQRHTIAELTLLPPVDQQEVWAAGVTYLRSKTARMEESEFSASAYDRVYAAARPELFFKALPEKVVASGEPVGIRQDAKWSVPEPELVLVVNAAGAIAGYTIGNDMSSRDIEGENLLYLPQAKMYSRSCALGPWVRVGVAESEARGWVIRLEIMRAGKQVFGGETSVDRIKRSFDELAGYLFRCQMFPHGAALLTGTGIVPPDTFTLEAGDEVTIAVDGIGVLRNPVIVV